ncbi:MAG: class I SAM-dependent methyltransferase [bacterium]
MARYHRDAGSGEQGGSAKHDDAFGLDIRATVHADLVHDLRSTPWPVPANHFKRVFCHDIVEHVPDVAAFLRELHRVCAPGAVVEIRTPHFSSWYAYNDPTHVHSFGYFFLDHFTTGETTVPSGGALFRYLERRFLFSKAHRLTGASALANRCPARYEQLFCWMFPCENLLIRMSPLK